MWIKLLGLGSFIAGGIYHICGNKLSAIYWTAVAISFWVIAVGIDVTEKR